MLTLPTWKSNNSLPRDSARRLVAGFNVRLGHVSIDGWLGGRHGGRKICEIPGLTFEPRDSEPSCD